MTAHQRKPAIRRIRPATQTARAVTTDAAVLGFEEDERPTAVGPVLAPEEVRALMDVAEQNASTMSSAPAKGPLPPRPRSGLRARVRPEASPAPDEVAVDFGSLQPAIEIEHIETDETHDIDVGDEP
jgi:hypothetical protein